MKIQKVYLKVYIKNKLRPLFVADITDDIEGSVKDFVNQLNNKDIICVQFDDRVGFNKFEYHHHEVIYK